MVKPPWSETDSPGLRGSRRTHCICVGTTAFRYAPPFTSSSWFTIITTSPVIDQTGRHEESATVLHVEAQAVARKQ